MNNEKLGKKKFNYKWIMVAICVLIVGVSLGFCSSTNSLFLNAITDYLQVERSLFALNQSIRYIATAVLSLFLGSLVARFGPKKLVIAGLTCLIGAMFVYYLAESIYVFYIGGLLLGLGFSFTGTTMVGYVVNIWSKENKGTIMGIILSSNGLVGAIATQIVSPIIDGSHGGYKNAYLLITIILAVLIALVLVFFRSYPKNYQGSKQAPGKKKSRGEGWVGIEFKELTKKWWFYALLVCVFFTGFVLQGITGIAVPHMKDIGMDLAFVSTVASVKMLSLTAFKFLTGVIYDKLGLRFTAVMCNVAAIIVMILLALITNSPSGMTLAIIYAVLSSLALPLETIMLPIYTGDLCGQKAYAKVLGIVVAINVAGFATGTPLVNLCYDLTGSYHLAFYICAVIMTVVLVALQFIMNASKKEKARVLAEQEMLEEQENLVAASDTNA